ncbi:MAG: S41 family peptidase [Reichenbachiella sp.]|uniref:S41 family peptidase n=1 Tax=Reichenbachiella sp. TaxID=2184521 RepID=UPI003264082B
MKYVILGILTIVATSIFAQKKEAFNPDQKFSADSVRKWTVEIMDELAAAQPGFYRYTSKARFDHLIDSTLQTISDSLNTLEFYRKLKPLFAQIGCLHTGLRLSEDYEKHIKNTSSLFPLEIFINSQNQVFVTKNHSNQSVPIKSEILTINDRPIDEILNILYNAIPTDGYNRTLKVLLLNYRFSIWYQSMIDLRNTFRLTVKTIEGIRTYTLAGVESKVFPSIDSLESAHKKQLVFEIKNGIGYLTIHSFAKTVINKNNQNFKKFIRKSFDALRQEQVKYLIVDVRHNTGGTDGNAAFLTSHFFNETFRYWEKIELTEYMAKQIKGIYRIFYSKPELKDSTYHWKGSLFTKEFNYYNVAPAKNHFEGKVFLITNGSCMSSCSDFAAILSHHKKAVVVGQECGGGYQGNTSGLMPNEDVHPNMIMTVPLLKYTTAVDHTKNIGRGTPPDYVTDHTVDDWIAKKDVEMELIENLIKKEE